LKALRKLGAFCFARSVRIGGSAAKSADGRHRHHRRGDLPVRVGSAGGPAGRFWRKAARTRTRLVAPALWEEEIGGATAEATRAGILPAAEEVVCLQRVQRLAIESLPTASLWEGALACAVSRTVPFRHALFAELAQRQRVPLVTFDDQLLRAFPWVAIAPD
jgi:predicted nucleic acid-binding protein